MAMNGKFIFVRWLYLVFVFSIVFSSSDPAPNSHMSTVSLHIKYVEMFKKIYSAIAESLYQCMEYCYSLKLCKSLTYWRSDQECRLSFTDADDWYSTTFGGDSVRRAKIPKRILGNCVDHTCDITEMCVPFPTGYKCVKHPYSTVKCPGDWGQIGDTCVKLWAYTNDTWSGAKESCAKSMGSILAETHTFEKEEFLWTYNGYICGSGRCVNMTNVWIGLRYSDDREDWVWAGSGKTVKSDNWTNWKSTQPIVTGPNYCAAKELESGDWIALDCDSQASYVCQIDAPEFWTE